MMGAYIKGNLRSNDYQIVNSLFISFVSLVLMALILCLKHKNLLGTELRIVFADSDSENFFAVESFYSE